MTFLKPNEKRAKNAIALIWIMLVMEIVKVLSGYLQYDLLVGADSENGISMEAANANDLRQMIVNIIYLIAYIISIVTFILWFRRAYYNLHVKNDNLNHTEGWAAGGWFVPIMSLYVPYQIMKELYEETKELLYKKGIDLSESLSTTYVGWWWGAWILNNVIAQIIFRTSKDEQTVEGLANATLVEIGSSAFGIVLALITVKVIKDYAAAEVLFAKIDELE